MNESDYIELCFVQWYELMNGIKHNVRKIDEILGVT